MNLWRNFSRLFTWALRLIPLLVLVLAPAISSQAQSPAPQLNPPPGYPNLPDGSITAALPPPIAPGIIHLNATAFNPENSSMQYEYAGVSLISYSAMPATFLASLSLPNHAEIKRVIFVYIDNNASADITMDLDYQPFDYVGYGQLGVATSSSADPTIRYAVVTNINPNLVDNSANTYLLTVTLPYGFDTEFISARIEYSYSAFAPTIYK